MYNIEEDNQCQFLSVVSVAVVVVMMTSQLCWLAHVIVPCSLLEGEGAVVNQDRPEIVVVSDNIIVSGERETREADTICCPYSSARDYCMPAEWSQREAESCDWSSLHE